MPCYHPMSAYRCEDGSVVFHEKQRFRIKEALSLPCGQCIGCRLERSRQWAVRCLHEASLYKSNCFLTLTYSEDKLPPDGSLRYSDFQKFMKRLRRRLGTNDIRFFMCGEYGEGLARPHYHVLLFNFDFPDKAYFKKSGAGSRLYTSALLADLWPYGHAWIGDVNFESAAYVARYCVKKVTGRGSAAAYTCPETGVIRTPEFAHMSLKPGIGAPWLDKYQSDVYPHDYVIVRGVKCKPPKYYDSVFERGNADDLDYIKAMRELDAYQYRPDNTPDRLAVKEVVHKARSSLLRRSFEG